MKTFRRILVPLDHEPHSREALEYAVTIASAFAGEVAVVHSDPMSGAFGGETCVLLFTNDRVPALAEKIRTKSAAPMHELLAELEDLGIPQGGMTVDAHDPARAILAAAKEADLVIMGSHGRTGALRLLRGSVSEVVARRATCPVMIVHAARRSAAGRSGVDHAC